MALNLEKQLLFYGSYHHDPINVGIHIVFVPILMATFFLMGAAGPSIPFPEAMTVPYFPLNAATILAILYSSLYVLMEPVAGGIFTVILLAWTGYANHLASLYGMTAVAWAAGINVFSWIAQFIGHGTFEGRKPALVDNIVQALFLAPLFVWMDILFALGYRQELRSRLNASVEKELEKLNAQKKDKAANGHMNGSVKSN